MAKVRVSAAFLANALFGCSEDEVFVIAAKFDPISNCLELDISGEDVPDAEEVHAEFTEQRNGMGDRFRTVRFKPI